MAHMEGWERNWTGQRKVWSLTLAESSGCSGARMAFLGRAGLGLSSQYLHTTALLSPCGRAL
jgi:hypothetical protein